MGKIHFLTLVSVAPGPRINSVQYECPKFYFCEMVLHMDKRICAYEKIIMANSNNSKMWGSGGLFFVILDKDWMFQVSGAIMRRNGVSLDALRKAFSQ